MHTVVDSLKLIRVANCILALLGVVIGAHMTRQWQWYYPVIVAGAAAFFICAAGNIVNDLMDIRIDRINRPDRILVRQMLSMRYAWILAAISTGLALVLAYTVNTAVMLSATLTIALLAAYNFGLKRIPLLGNALIALLGAMTFLTGGWAVGADIFAHPEGALAPAILAFVLHLVREILKDIEDIDGDRRAQVKTLPQVVGTANALRMALVLFFLLVILTLMPVLLHWYRPAYAWLTIFGIDLPLSIVMIAVYLRPDRGRVRIGSLGLKLGMGLGLIALILA